jgi:hypothetical protein
VKAHIYIEGAESKEDQVRCREGFRALIGKLGFAERKKMPRLSACGGRNSAFDDFKTAHSQRKEGDYIAMLVDSEDPVADVEKPWDHLRTRDNWVKPTGASDDQVLLMTTCMETWIVADRPTLREHYGHKLHEGSLPPLHALEQRNRHDVQDKLERATRECQNGYAKGKRSFEAVAKLNPAELSEHLPSFARLARVLNEKL